MQCFNLILSKLFSQFFNTLNLLSKETPRISSPLQPQIPLPGYDPNFKGSFSYHVPVGMVGLSTLIFRFLFFVFRLRLYHKQWNPVGWLRGLFISSKCPAQAKARNLGNTHPDHRPFPTLLEVRTASPGMFTLKKLLRSCLKCKLVYPNLEA